MDMNLSNLNWIKELVTAEQQMEESGVVDISAGYDPQKDLKPQTTLFLNDLKTQFVEAANAFNQLKGSTAGRIKIYGISKTEADFMIFRNGFKLIFSAREPGKITVSFNQLGSTYVPGQEATATIPVIEENVLVSRWGAFGDLIWTYQDQVIKADYLVRYYLSRFIRESAR